jgi:nucleotide-binding universal stress UspA family protein
LVFRQILVPLDGSPRSEHALALALSIARASNSQIHVALVHVPAAYRDYDYPGVEDLELDVKRREHQYLHSLPTRLHGSPSRLLHIHHLEGIPEETLAEEVQEREIDLVVMNAHGWGFVSRAITGSVSDYLVRHLTVPILLMHSQGATADLNRDLALRRILVCLDGSPLAEAMLEPATALGRLWGAEYHLLRVAAPPDHLSPGHDAESQALFQHYTDKAKRSSISYLDGVAQRLRSAGLAVHTHVSLSRNVAAAILEEANTAGCDSIAISTHGRGGLARLLLGSVADKVARGADRPVLLYRPPSEG